MENITKGSVYDCSSLNAAADTNHTCNIDFPPVRDYDNVRENGTTADGKIFIHPKWVKHKKIYSILSSRNRNGSNIEHTWKMSLLSYYQLF